MIEISATGSIGYMVESMRSVHGRLVPYAASTALTRSAHTVARNDLVNEMTRVFKNPRPYTLNSLRVEGATKDNLTARIHVKNQAVGTKPEHFLFPQVEGGPRNAKRFERALGAMGVIRSGDRVVPAHGLAESKYESGAFIRSVLRDVQSGARKRGRRRFAAAVGLRKTRGIWEASGRNGRRLTPLFIFTSKQPSYRRLFPFYAVARAAAAREFPKEFSRALGELHAKGWQV